MSEKIQPYFYEVASSWYEEYNPKIFLSFTKYSQEEFEQFIKQLIDQAYDNLKKEKHDSFIGNYELIFEVWKLLEKQDFKEINKQAIFNLWGSCIIEEDDEEYKDKINKQTLQEIYDHNSKITSRIYKKD